MGGSQTLLSLESVSKTYQMGEVDVTALRAATLSVELGELLVVCGPSGSGKSTLLNIIGGMDRPSEGRLCFENEPLARASDKRLTLYRRHEVGFIFQFYNLIPTLTALENIEVATEIATRPLDPSEVLDMVGLSARASHFPSQLSGGEQQRVAIARALAGNPRLLLCDEPTGALDLETSRQVLGLLVDLKQRLHKTIILITHNNAIAALGDRIAQMRDGRIVAVRENPTPTPVEQITW